MNIEKSCKDNNVSNRVFRMWELNNKLSDFQELSQNEIIFYNENLEFIKFYYEKRYEYWQGQSLIK